MSSPSRSTKTKLTLSIDKTIKQNAENLAKQKRMSLSGLVENFLEFFADPKVYCYKCSSEFVSSESSLCPKCGWMICPKCKACGCGLSNETVIAVSQMRKVYEDLIGGRVKKS
jgi:hypothetical protein